LPTDPGLGLSVGLNAFSTITAGLANIASGGTLVIFAGTYSEPVVAFNVPLGAIDISTNPGDPATPTEVAINGNVLLAKDAIFNLVGVTTGAGVSSAANLTFAGTVDGPAGLIVQGSAALTFRSPVGGAI